MTRKGNNKQHKRTRVIQLPANSSYKPTIIKIIRHLKFLTNNDHKYKKYHAKVTKCEYKYTNRADIRLVQNLVSQSV